MTNIDKKYDVIIMTHAPKDDLLVSIEKLSCQTIKPNKIIIYNTCKEKFDTRINDKATLYLIIDNKYKDLNIEIHHIEEDEFDHGKSRNDALKFCNSKYALFMTDDVIPYDNYMASNLIEAFDKYSDLDLPVSAVYARQIAKSDAKLKERYVREYNYPEYDIIKDKSKENYFCSNVCQMYDVNILKELGCFEENIILNEDTFFIYSAINSGYKVIYCSDAKVLHSHNYTYSEQFSRNFDIGVSQKEKDYIFKNINSKKEGLKLVKYVTIKLIKGMHFICLVDFLIECYFRLKGFKIGLNFEKLSIDECIKYASNKKYFKKKHVNI